MSAHVAVGMRVQLSLVVHAPYTRRADLTIDDRLATIVGRDDGVWIAEDTHGERHRVSAASLEAATDDPGQARWRIEGAIPAYAVGERLLLHWRHRSTGRVASPPRPDTYCTVVAETTRTVTARLDDGSQIELYRWGAQADEPARQAPRWFVTARG
jgi:hypothetical protein